MPRATALFLLALGSCARPGHTPPAPLDFDETEVMLQAGDHVVHGTLTRPNTRRDTPAVLIIAGSGPTDRDWNGPLLPGDNGSGRLLAHALAERSIASLRYDKYGLTGLEAPLHWDDYRQEQAAAIEHLHGLDGVSSVWVVGHSEGALHALDLAGRRGDLDGVVLLASPGRSLFDLLVAQVSAQSTPDDARAFADAMERVRDGEGELHLANPNLDALLASLQHPLTRPFLDELLTFDPTSAVATLDEPLLIVQGGRDLQVSPGADADLLEGAARTGGGDVTRVDLAWSDHVFKLETRDTWISRGGLDYNADDRQLDPSLPAAIARWIYR